MKYELNQVHNQAIERQLITKKELVNNEYLEKQIQK